MEGKRIEDRQQEKGSKFWYEKELRRGRVGLGERKNWKNKYSIFG